MFSLELALAAYSAGEDAVEPYGRHVPPYRETLAYVRSVMKVYQRLMDQAHASWFPIDLSPTPIDETLICKSLPKVGS